MRTRRGASDRGASDRGASDRGVTEVPPVLLLPNELMTIVVRGLPAENVGRLASTCKSLRGSILPDDVQELYKQEKSGLREIELLPVGGLNTVGRILKALGAKLNTRCPDIDDWMFSSPQFRNLRFFENVDRMKGVERAKMKAKLIESEVVMQAWRRAPKPK